MSWTIREGDCLDVLRELDAGSIQTCVTSPPYWGLRDYGTATWDGGDSECDHIRVVHDREEPERPVGWDGPFRNTGEPKPVAYGEVCGKCGAKRIDSQLGLEPTPEQYVENLVAVFREVRRVLRDDGTVWLNLGDSYAGGGGYSPGSPSNVARQEALANGDDRDGAFVVRGEHNYEPRRGTGRAPSGLKSKDLVGIPWRVAFALQADGWWLRSDIIWSKPNPMPESVTDRPTRAHEYIFLLSKSARYFYDADAIREKHTMRPQRRPEGRPVDEIRRGNGQPKQSWPTASRDEVGIDGHHGGRNRRSVWEIATQPYPEAHFATFPPKLIEPCVLAGSPPKCCGECGAPWERVTEVERDFEDRPGHPTRYGDTETMSAKGYGMPSIAPPSVETLGWRSTCQHDEGSGQATVLDPFAGAGTTGLVATQHGRDFIGIELNPEYAEMARERIRRYEVNPAGALEGDPEPIEGQLGLDGVDGQQPSTAVVDKQGALGKRTYTGFNERWKNRDAS